MGSRLTRRAMALVLVLLFAALSPLTGETVNEVHQYCIVGAGPAGVQLGHFLHHAGRDYVIFERNPRAGSFFEKFPRHRKLISLNKRHVREGRSKDFALRHDWNSLLDVRPEAEQIRPMTQRSKELFPHADVLAAYLAEFAEEQNASIRYNTQVGNLRRAEAGRGFLLDLPQDISTQDVQTVQCREVIMATGLGTPRDAYTTVDGADLVTAYEDLPETGESFEGKAVLILGAGNAGMETAQALMSYTSELHVFGRTKENNKGEMVKFAHQTHYVGDLRAGRLTLLDTYLLKSLDTFDFDAMDDEPKMLVLRCMGNRLCVWHMDKDDCEEDRECEEKFSSSGQGSNFHLPMGDLTAGSPLVKQVRTLLTKYAPEQESPPAWHISEASTRQDIEEGLQLSEEEIARRKAKGIEESDYSGKFHQITVSADLLRKNPELLDFLVTIRSESTNDNLRYPMDHIVRCFGWKLNTSVFADSLLEELVITHKGKFPKLRPTYEARGVNGLYFAGSATHGLDFRKSAGGFIHGFRYTARALFRFLEEKNFGVPWPTTVFPLHADPMNVEPLLSHLLDRINNASGPYQMFGSLGDVVLFERRDDGLAARYLEEFPIEQAHYVYNHIPRLVWIFKYGDDFHGRKVLGKDRVGSSDSMTAEKANFLHPKMSFFPALTKEPTMQHWLYEDIFTSWQDDTIRDPFRRFLARVVTSLAAPGAAPICRADCSSTPSSTESSSKSWSD